VYRLNKSLYGLKYESNAWYSMIDGYLQSMGFTKSEMDPNLYFILVGDDPLISVLYVDGLFLTGVEEFIARCKAYLASEFEMEDIDLMQFLGVRGMASIGRDLPWKREVCSRDIEEIQDGGL
jgi:hypothetical protein